VTRTILQTGFLILTVVAVFLLGSNAELWCPFGGVEALYTYVKEGNLPCSLGVSNFYILAGVLLMTILARRVFCSYVCPLGTIYEWAHLLGRRLRLPRWQPTGAAARVLPLGKYLMLVVILWFTYRTAELVFRGFDPCYVLLSRHGEDITIWAYVVAGATLLGAMFTNAPFCRWLCPLAAVLQPFSKVGLLRVKRDRESCTDCERCTRVCAMQIGVHEAEVVAAARCTNCLECVTSCPVQGGRTLALSIPGGRLLSRWPQVVVGAVVLLCVGAAALGATLMPAPSFTYDRGQAAGETATVELMLEELSCRGRGSLLVFFLDRDDEFALPGQVRLEAWPGPGEAKIRVHYDAGQVGADDVRQAITEPYYNPAENLWRASPFRVVDQP